MITIVSEKYRLTESLAMYSFDFFLSLFLVTSRPIGNLKVIQIQKHPDYTNIYSSFYSSEICFMIIIILKCQLLAMQNKCIFYDDTCSIDLHT